MNTTKLTDLVKQHTKERIACQTNINKIIEELLKKKKLSLVEREVLLGLDPTYDRIEFHLAENNYIKIIFDNNLYEPANISIRL